MKKLPLLTSILLILAMGSLTANAVASPATSESTAEVAKKKKKKSSKCKAGYKKSGGKCKKGPYRKGQTCAMSKQTEYIKYGFICQDISTPGFPLTYLDIYKK